MTESIIWISTISEALYAKHYGDAIRTWHNLPGRKIVLFDGQAPVLDGIEFIDYWAAIKADQTNWFTKKRGKKAMRLSYKAWAIHWAIKNLDYDRIIFIDADISVHKPVPTELLSNQDHLWSTLSFNHSSNAEWSEYGQQVESGLQIFNCRHPDIHPYVDTYIDFYESEKVYELYRPYDNWVSRAMLDLYPMNNLVLDPTVVRAVGEDTMKFTRFNGYMTHYLGKDNKENIPVQDIK